MTSANKAYANLKEVVNEALKSLPLQEIKGVPLPSSPKIVREVNRKLTEELQEIKSTPKPAKEEAPSSDSNEPPKTIYDLFDLFAKIGSSDLITQIPVIINTINIY